jgi:hypothetical protein
MPKLSAASIFRISTSLPKAEDPKPNVRAALVKPVSFTKFLRDIFFVSTFLMS